MDYRKLGRSDLTVSAIILGTMTWGEQNSEAEARDQLDLATELGVTTIDTAEMYPSPPRAETHGHTEAIIGRWLKDRGHRDRIVLASKVTGRSSKDYLRPWGEGTRLDRRNIEAALDSSLKRLQTDYLDLYQLHWPDRKTNIFGRLDYRHDAADQPIPLEETLGVLQDLITAGKIRAFGLSNESPWGMMKCCALADSQGLPRPASIQNAYSLVNRIFEMSHAEIAHREDIGLLAYSPLGMGLLTGKYRQGQRPAGARLVRYDYYDRYTVSEGQRAAESYAEIAERHGLAPNHLALAFLLKARPFVAGAIIGATSCEQLRANIQAAEVSLSKEILAEIEAIHRRFPNPCP